MDRSFRAGAVMLAIAVCLFAMADKGLAGVSLDWSALDAPAIVAAEPPVVLDWKALDDDSDPVNETPEEVPVGAANIKSTPIRDSRGYIVGYRWTWWQCNGSNCRTKSEWYIDKMLPAYQR